MLNANNDARHSPQGLAVINLEAETMKVLRPLIALLFLSLLACSPELKEVTGDNYSLTIPPLLTEVDHLNADASLQYQDSWRELYVMLIHEPKADFSEAIHENRLAGTYSDDLQGYSTIVIDGLGISPDSVSNASMENILVNDMRARLVSFTGVTQGKEVYYALGFYEGAKDYYQVMTYTLAEKESVNEEDMRNILLSLKEEREEIYRD